MADQIHTLLKETIPLWIVWVFTLIDLIAEFFIDRPLPFPCYPAIFFILVSIVNAIFAARFSAKIAACENDPLCVVADHPPADVEGSMIRFFDEDEKIISYFRYRDDEARVIHRLSMN